MNTKISNLRRSLSFASALILAVIGILPALSFSSVGAIAQVTGRSMALSDSTPGATNTTYAMTFTLPDASQSLVVDFCAESPIIGGTCTTPTGFTAATASYNSGVTGTVPTPGGAGSTPTGWSNGTMSAGTVKLTSTTATTAGTKYTFYITNIKNPTTTGTFYARVYTYTNATYGATAYASPTSPGSYIDYGGFAMSTANNVTITAVVMETLKFCVSKAAPTPNCAGTTTPALTLGHGTPQALDTSVVDTDTAYMQLSTNALSGASVTAKTTSSTTCSGLSRDGGATCAIPAHGTTAQNIVAGTANFGLAVGASSLATGSTFTGSATVNPVSPYGGTPTNYYMDTTKPYSTFGDAIASTTSACQDNNSLLTYAAAVSATTPAGVYTTTQALIATGTF